MASKFTSKISKVALSCLTVLLFLPHILYGYQIGDVDVKLLAGANAVYDTNITYANTKPLKDIITEFNLGIKAALEGKTRKLNLGANLRQQLYSRYNQYTNLSETLNLDFVQELSSRSRFTLNDAFIHAMQPPTFEAEFGRSGTLFKYYTNDFKAEYRRELLKNLTFIWGYGNQYYEPISSDYSISLFNRGTVETDYSLGRDTVLIALYEYQHRRFQDIIGITTNRYAGGFRQYMTNQLYLDCRVGEDYAKASSGFKNNSLFVSASLVNEPDDRGSLKLSYTKQDTTTNYNQDIFRSERAEFSWVRQLFKRLNVSVTGFFGKGYYVISQIKDNLVGGSGRLTYELSDKAKLSLNYSYSKATSNVSTRNYAKNVVLLALNIEF